MKLPRDRFEWLFVVVLLGLFGGMVFYTVDSQLQLREIRRAQAERDTRLLLTELTQHVRAYHAEHGRVEATLTAMGVPLEAMETRHAVVDDVVSGDAGTVVVTARLRNYSPAHYSATIPLSGGEMQLGSHD